MRSLKPGIEVIQSMLAARDAGASAKVIEGIADSPGETSTLPTPRKTRKKRSDASPLLPDAEPSADSADGSTG